MLWIPLNKASCFIYVLSGPFHEARENAKQFQQEYSIWLVNGILETAYKVSV